MENEKDWTIMVYMAGDNNLSTEMAYALDQIKSITTQTNKINLFVYYDGYSNNIPTLYCDFTEPNAVNYYRSFKIENKLIKRSNNVNYNENSASVNNIINFVDWCVNKIEHKVNDKTFFGRKANKYAMIISGHSMGFQNWGLFKDEKANYHMSLSLLRWMFERITYDTSKLKIIADAQKYDDEKKGRTWSEEFYKERTTEILGKPLALLGFDSCVMSTLEIASQFQHIAETMVASEGSIPNAGWSYAQILLEKITNQNLLSSREMAASIVETFIKQQNKFSLADISVDMAAWDLSKLSDLDNAFTVFAENLLLCFEDENSISYKQMKRVILQAHWQSQSYMMEQNVDLGDFCQLLINEINSLKNEINLDSSHPILKFRDSCKEVIKEIRKCIILTGFSGSNYQFSNGISLFFPWSLNSYKVSSNDYEKLTFVKNNNGGKKWKEFLIKYLSKISYRKAKPLTNVDASTLRYKIIDDSIVYQSYKYSDSLDIIDNKIPENGSNKIPENGSNKIPENGSNKIPENGSNKIFNALNLFISQFTGIKNIESFWNHAGFTSNQAEFVTEMFKINPNLQNLVKDLDNTKYESKLIIKVGSETTIQQNSRDETDM